MITVIFIIFIFLIIFSIYKCIKYNLYKKSIYCTETRNKYNKVIKNKKSYTDYLIVNELSKLPGVSKFIINAYITTSTRKITELDIIFIHETGIYVVKYMGYSGWIYGNEDSNSWVQILENKQKCFFHNPILQNNSHIRALDRELQTNNLQLFKSFIIFDDQCMLKKLDVLSSNIIVLKQNKIFSHLKKHIGQSKKSLTPLEIYTIYRQLKPLTIVSRLKNK